MNKQKLLDWIKLQRKMIIDPDNTGDMSQDTEDEGKEAQLQILEELSEEAKQW